MRRPVLDDRWQRTPGNLLVPRRPMLPTRRYIQKMGAAKECCEVLACVDPPYTGTIPAQLQVDIEGTTAGECDAESCAALDGTYVVPYSGTANFGPCGSGASVTVSWYLNLPEYPLICGEWPYQYYFSGVEVILQCCIGHSTLPDGYSFTVTCDTPGTARAWSSAVLDERPDFADFAPVVAEPWDRSGEIMMCMGGYATISIP